MRLPRGRRPEFQNHSFDGTIFNMELKPDISRHPIAFDLELMAAKEDPNHSYTINIRDIDSRDIGGLIAQLNMVQAHLKELADRYDRYIKEEE